MDNAKPEAQSKSELREYPELVDPFLDFEATSAFWGSGSCNLDIVRMGLDSGEILVYLTQQREGSKSIDTSIGPKRVCERGIAVCGYEVKPRGILRFFKDTKIRPIRPEQLDEVKSELAVKLKWKPDYIEFMHMTPYD